MGVLTRDDESIWILGGAEGERKSGAVPPNLTPRAHGQSMVVFADWAIWPFSHVSAA